MRLLTLPYPPSVNTYWRSLVINGSARVVISERGRLYRDAVHRAVLATGAGEVFTAEKRLTVEVDVYPPNRRSFDLDNLGKSLLDSITYAGVWFDDSQIDRLVFTRMSEIGGMVKVRIQERNTPMTGGTSGQFES